MGIQNIQFTRLIKANGRWREFNFRKSTASGIELYKVDVPDDKGERIYLTLRKKDSFWAVIEQISLSWLQEASNSFHTVIQEFE